MVTYFNLAGTFREDTMNIYRYLRIFDVIDRDLNRPPMIEVRGR